MINVLKIIFLFVGLWFTLVNMSKTFLHDIIPFANFFWQAIGITGFVYLQWLI